MTFPKRTCLFLCLMAGCGWANEGQQEDLLNYTNHLESQVVSSNYQSSIHLLEEKLMKLNFSGMNITLVNKKIQYLVFKLSCNFSGLTINASSLMKVQTKHVIQFPTELTRGACKKRKSPQELRLICIYFDMKYFFQDDDNSPLLNDIILGARLANHSVSSLQQSINIHFWHNESMEKYNLTCVFWKEGAGNNSWGAWSTEGCKTVLIVPDQVLCHCDHLTYFAVLMKLSSTKLNRELLAPLTYLSIVGCSLSIVASLLTILLHFYSRKILGCFPRTFSLEIIKYSRKKSDSTTNIHMNLHVSVILLNVSFLISPSLTLQKVGCQIIAALLHYTLLSCLTWLAIEGLNLYLLLVRVYNIYIRRYILKLCALGWGLPAFIVLSILLLKSSAYGPYKISIKTSLENDTNSQNASMCWIKSVEIHGIFVMGYAGTISLFNLIILIWAVKILHGLRSREKKWESQPCRDITTVLGLTILLGITWDLAFFSFEPFLLIQLFLFTIFNSLYGFFLFLWFCVQKRHSELKAETSSSSQMIQIRLQNHHSPVRSPQVSSVTCLSSPLSPRGTSYQEGMMKEDIARPGT